MARFIKKPKEEIGLSPMRWFLEEQKSKMLRGSLILMLQSRGKIDKLCEAWSIKKRIGDWVEHRGLIKLKSWRLPVFWLIIGPYWSLESIHDKSFFGSTIMHLITKNMQMKGRIKITVRKFLSYSHQIVLIFQETKGDFFEQWERSETKNGLKWGNGLLTLAVASWLNNYSCQSIYSEKIERWKETIVKPMK